MTSRAALVASLALLLGACGRGGGAAATGGGRDPYEPEIVVTQPSGEPVRVAWDGAPPGPRRVTGTFRFAHAVSGRTSAERVAPPRSGEGTVDLVDRTEAAGGGVRRTSLAGTIRLVADGKTSDVPLDLSFDRDAKGNFARRTMRLDLRGGGESLRADLEVLFAAFTDRFRFPADAVRVGDAFAPPEVMALEESLQRPLFFLFQRRATRGEAIGAPVEGRVWIEARETVGGDDCLRARIAVLHAYEGETDPGGRAKDNVRIAYRAAIEGSRAVGVADGLPRAHDLVLRRRFRYVAPDFDYVVTSEGAARLAWAPAAR